MPDTGEGGQWSSIVSFIGGKWSSDEPDTGGQWSSNMAGTDEGCQRSSDEPGTGSQWSSNMAGTDEGGQRSSDEPGSGEAVVDDEHVTAELSSNHRRHRGRFKDVSTWKCHMRQRLKNAGMSYVSRNGVRRRPKLLKPGCGSKCRQKCHERISAEHREKIFTSFWQLGNLHSQRQFLMSHVVKNDVKQKSSGSRKRSLKYTFHVHGQVLHVCKTFFLDTLSISDQTVKTTLSKMTADGYLLPDQRKQPACHRLPDCVREAVKSHIAKFQTVPSHYCRHTSSKQYLPRTLTMTDMYRMYKKECRDENRTPVKKEFYFNIFHKDFNLAFHKPKKDMCDFCEKYSRSSDAKKEEMNEVMKMHMKNKKMCRELKEQEKLRAQNDHTVKAACYDLQQVLTTPHSMSSQLYYRRKLATYNLTVFDLAKKDGYCYMWHEGVAKRGASNIASCVWKYMAANTESGQCSEFVFFTDNCGGQNKNKTMAAMYLHAVRTLSVERISHYYLEAGHTQNEGDSMHAVIERASKHVNVYTPVQWYTLASSAKKSGSSYTVTEMEGHMKDFKALGESYCKRLQEAVSLKSPEWHKIKALMVEKQSPHVLFVKYSHEESSFIPFVNTTANNQSDLSLSALENVSTVSKAKKDDLLYMCNQLIIPKDYHSFYSLLALDKEPTSIQQEEGPVTTATSIQQEEGPVTTMSQSQEPHRKRRCRDKQGSSCSEAEAKSSSRSRQNVKSSVASATKKQKL